MSDIHEVSFVVCNHKGGIGSLGIHVVYAVGHVLVAVGGDAGGRVAHHDGRLPSLGDTAVVVHTHPVCVGVSVDPAPNCVHITRQDGVEPSKKFHSEKFRKNFETIKNFRKT